MIWSIKYKRTIGSKIYDKTATFITKEKNKAIVQYKWLMQHSSEFIKNVTLISIDEKYKKLED